jgi:putative tRNA adenosine deaminase-associated protein
VSYFAAALARTESGWTGEELDLDEVADLEALTDVLRDLTGEGPGPGLLMLEEDDEYVAVVRADGGIGSLSEPRVFLSDQRAVQQSDVAAMLWEQGAAPDPDDDDDDDEGTRPVAEPVGEAGLLSDLGVSADALLALCAQEGRLPADVLTEVCERAGCADVLEDLRDG